MKYIFAVIFLMVAPVAVAQPVQVRSGEHVNFTRIVLDVALGTEWVLKSDAAGARIRLVDHTAGFDTGDVFEKIDRSMVAEVRSEPDSLDIEFACACEAVAFGVGERMIAIDISVAQETEAATPILPSAFVGQTALRFSGDPATAEAPGVNWSQEPTASDTVAMASPDQALPILPDVPAEPTDLEALVLAQKKLADRVAAAATRGILQPSAGSVEIPDIVSRPQVDTRVFEDFEPRPLDTPVGGNLRVSSSADIPDRALDSLLSSTTLGVRCIDPELVAVQDWAPDAGFGPAVSSLRGQLYSEFDRLDTSAVIDLTRTYLHFGFGAEALQTLALDEVISREQPALRNLAEIMEFGHGRSIDYLSHFVDCDTDVALWAILSNEVVDPSRTINSDAAIRTLSALPMHLRRFVAPELSTRLIEYGDEASAAVALRGLERTDEPLGDPANLAKATLELHSGETASAKARLSNIVSSNSEQSAKALIAFVETQMETDGQVEEEIATLVEAYAMELRDAPIGLELLQAHVIALAKSGQYDRAFDALTRVKAKAEPADVDALRSTALDLLTQNASNEQFLRISFEQVAAHSPDIATGSRLSLARRFANLGFFAEAETVLAASNEVPDGSAMRLLRARISLGLSRPAEALTFLQNVKGDEAIALRAEAQAQTGDFETAHMTFSALGDQNNSQRAAWLSEDWTVLLEPAEPVFGPVAQVAQTELQTDAAREGMLLRTTTALQESAQARQTIEALLRSTSAANEVSN